MVLCINKRSSFAMEPVGSVFFPFHLYWQFDGAEDATVKN